MEKLQYQRHNDTHIIVYNDSDLSDFYQNNSNLTDFDEAMVPEFKWVILWIEYLHLSVTSEKIY